MSTSSGELTFATMLAHPEVRMAILENVNKIQWRSMLARKVIDYFSSDRVLPGKYPELTEIHTYLASDSYLIEEVNYVKKLLKGVMVLPESSISHIIEDFQTFFKKQYFVEALEDNATDPISAIQRIQDIPELVVDKIPLLSLGETDVKAVLEREINSMDVLPSSSKIMQLTPWKGYARGQVVVIVAAPGSGKSLFMHNEVIGFLKEGYKVHYTALGDLTESDFITRSTTLIKNIDYSKVVINPIKYFDEECREVTKNFTLTCLPAGYVTAEQYMEFVESVVVPRYNPDVFVIDYDSNFAESTDNMYIQGRLLYNKLTQLARPVNAEKFRVVFVASQPKPEYWSEEEIPMQACAESSAKQHVVDLMITIGRSDQIDNQHCGIIKIVKIRRGDANKKIYYERTGSGRFNEISSMDYNLKKKHTGSSREKKKQNKSQWQNRK